MRIRALIGPVVLGALLGTTPQLALGQDEGEKRVVSCDGCRPGTEISGVQLGEFLAKSVTFVNPGIQPCLAAAEACFLRLRLELISREEGAIAKYESEAVEVEGGKTYSASTWLDNTGGWRHGLGGQMVSVTGFGVWEDTRDAWRARECQDATHAVQITLASGGERADILSWSWLCLNVER